jgi:hypothetical protein
MEHQQIIDINSRLEVLTYEEALYKASLKFPEKRLDEVREGFMWCRKR